MKQYKKIDNNHVLLEEDGEAPRVIDIAECQLQLQAIRNIKAKQQEKEDKIQEEINQAILAIQNSTPK